MVETPGPAAGSGSSSSPGSRGTSAAASRAPSPPTPTVGRVIGVDVVPAARRHRRRLVRARRHPQPGDRQGDRQGGRRHRRAHERHLDARQRRRPRHDEGAQRHRHDAAARRVPEGAERPAPRREVHDHRVRRQQPRPGDVHRGHGAAPGAALRLRQGRRRDRGLRARLRPPPPRRPGDHAALRQRHRPARRQPAHVVLPAAGHPDRARLRRPAAVPPRARPHRRAPATRSAPTCPAPSTSPATAS